MIARIHRITIYRQGTGIVSGWLPIPVPWPFSTCTGSYWDGYRHALAFHLGVTVY